MRLKEPGTRRRRPDRSGDVLGFPETEKTVFDLRAYAKGKLDSVRSALDFQFGNEQMPSQPWFEVSEVFQLYILLYPDEPLELSPERVQVMKGWMKDARKAYERGLGVDHYLTALRLGINFFPEAQRVLRPASKPGLKERIFGTATEQSWNATTTDIESWAQKIESFRGPLNNSAECLATCEMVFLLSLLAPQTLPRIKPAIEGIVRKPQVYSDQISKLEISERLFPIILAFPEFKRYFPFSEKDIPELVKQWDKAFTSGDFLPVILNRNTKAILMASSAELIWLNGKVKYKSEPRLASTVPLPERLSVG